MNNPTTSVANPGPQTIVFEEEALFSSKNKFTEYTREISCYLNMGHQVTVQPYVAVMAGPDVTEFYFWWEDIWKYVLFYFPTGSTLIRRAIPEEHKIWVEVKTTTSLDQIVQDAKKSIILTNPALTRLYPTLTSVDAINNLARAVNDAVAPEKPKLPTKLTPDDITKAIAEAQYHVLPGTRVTICLLILRNGAKVVGVNYGSIDPAQHREDMGRQEAYKDAVNKVWELEGYLLRQRLYEAGETLGESHEGDH